jgi:uncharacterized MAPEG superfamily protein
LLNLTCASLRLSPADELKR